MDTIYSVIRFFVAGGPFMYPILIVFTVGLAIAIERYITLTRIRRQNDGMWTKLQPALADGDFDAVGDEDADDGGRDSDDPGQGGTLGIEHRLGWRDLDQPGVVPCLDGSSGDRPVDPGVALVGGENPAVDDQVDVGVDS